MKTNVINKTQRFLPYFIMVLLSIYYFASIMQVPFHPDESTQIYMSSDLEKFFTSPEELFWVKNGLEDRRMELRMLDAPLSRYFIGIARLISGQDPTTSDWDWSLTYVENQENGALPSKNLLFSSRLAVSFLFPFSLVLIWHLLKKNFGALAGWFGIFATAGNALVLLHTRRAMAESLTFFFVICLIYFLFSKRPNPLLLGLLAALVVSAKQSTIIWLIVILALLLVGSQFRMDNFKQKLRNLSLCAVAFIVVVFLLNPFMWKHPIQSSKKALDLRQALVQQQTADIYRVSPGAALFSPIQRISSLIGNLYFTPPAVVDTANYVSDLEININMYSNNPANRMFRDMTGGSIILLFTLLGVYTIFRSPSPAHHREEILLLIAGCLQFLVLAIIVTLPFQRYVIPLVPTAIIFFAVGTSKFIELVYKEILLARAKRSHLD